jgi:hypothetical protein
VTKSIDHVISALVYAETKAAIDQCEQSRSSGSNIFNDHVVGEEVLHAGVYLMVVRESLTRISLGLHSDMQKAISECRHCISTLTNSAANVTKLLLSVSSEATSHTDPRPAVAESWFQAMSSLQDRPLYSFYQRDRWSDWVLSEYLCRLDNDERPWQQKIASP